MLCTRAWILALAVWLAPFSAAAAPNIVFILLDDVGYDDLGVQGNDFIQTPRIDGVAAEGLRFTRYYSSAPWCAPSRAAILTGLHPSSFDVHSALFYHRGLPEDIATLPGVLREAGYVTGHFGKWHLGRSDPQYLPTSRGFDHAVIRANNDNGAYNDQPLLIDDTTEVQSSGHVTDVITDYVLSFIQENSDRPFFANVWYNNAHRPHDPPARWADFYPDTNQGLYAGLVSHADEQIGRILDRLRDLGLEKDTLVVITSDHGDVDGDDGVFSGKKGTVFEGGIRVPAVARWPGTLPAGEVDDLLFTGIDWLPTLTEFAGVDTSELALHGESFASAWLGGEVSASSRLLFWEAKDGIRPLSSQAGDLRVAARDGPWKLVLTQNPGSRIRLFDVESDPNESKDLAATFPERVDDLLLEYRAWRRDVARIEAPVASLEGDATIKSDRLMFRGGAAILEANPRFDFAEGNFTFEAAVTAGGIAGEQTIASRPGSWNLVIDAVGHIRLEMKDLAGASVQLQSQEVLEAGKEAVLAFTIADWKAAASTVRLYLDGRLQTQSDELEGGADGTGAIRLGNDASGARALRGSIRNPAFYRAAFSEADLNDGDLDGVPRAVDNCTEEKNPLQIDSDLDGFGNACDADYDGSGHVMLGDFELLRQALYSRAGDPAYRPELDRDSDGLINLLEFEFVRSRYGSVPGPSGLACAGSVPCQAP